MFNHARTKFSKPIISIIVLVFVFSAFSGVFLLADQSQAQQVVSDPFLGLIQGNYTVSEAAKFTFLQSLDETTAYFFKTALASVLNDIAKQSATWVASGGQGQTPQFLSDPHYWAKTYDAQLGGLIQTALQKWLPFNICDFDPKLAINLTLANPFTANPATEGSPLDGKKTCSWTELRDKWTEFANDPLKSFQFNLNTTTGSLGTGTTALYNMVLDQNMMGKWNDKFCDTNIAYPATCPGGNNALNSGFCPVASPSGEKILFTTARVNILQKDIVCNTQNNPTQLQQVLKQYIDKTNVLMEALRYDLDFAVNCKKNAATAGAGVMKVWNILAEEKISGYDLQAFQCTDTFPAEAVAEVRRGFQALITKYREPVHQAAVSYRKCAIGSFNDLMSCNASINWIAQPSGAQAVPTSTLAQIGIKAWDQVNIDEIANSYKNIFTTEFCDPIKNPENVQQYCAPGASGAGYLREAQDYVANYIKDIYKTNIYYNQVKEKVDYIAKVLETLDGFYGEIDQQVAKNFATDNWKDAAAYDAQKAKEYFADVKETQTLDYVTKSIANKGVGGYVSSLLQSGMDQGWVGQTKKISGERTSPPSLVEEKAKQNIVGTYKDQVQVYTKNVIADAWSIFQATLFDELTKNLLANLLSGGTTTKKKQAAAVKKSKTEVLPIQALSPYEQEINTAEGFAAYAQKTVEKYAAKIAAGANLNLLADFQLTYKNQLNANIYNGVIDENFAQAINNKMTIAEAITAGKLVGSRRFSWDGEIKEDTYSLDNIKKLRKARVVPLGLELAVELIRDCKYRQSNNFADFNDIKITDPAGFNEADEPYKTQRLQNCMFKIAANATAEEVISAQNYNQQKLNEVVSATLQDVVAGFDKSGSGICGDFDPDESMFCNLVSPNWVLKIPPTRCGLQSDTPLWGEVIQSNESGQRYDYCPDFLSCLEEDGLGGCVNDRYGYCVKEKNIWQFSSGYCPLEYASCKNYTLNTSAGSLPVSYLKNTLSGSDVCNSNNAGCLWYSNDYSNGSWDPDSRIYLNRNVAACDDTGDGCTELALYRDPGNNLVTDSSFEYTSALVMPANWDLTLKQDITDVADATCEGIKYASCNGYNYALPRATSVIEASAKQLLCQDNGGTWENVCSDVTQLTVLDCINSGGTWGKCANAVKFIDVTAVDYENQVSDCNLNGGTPKLYCATSQLSYNLCLNPQFVAAGAVTAETQCTDNGGTWETECQTDEGVATELSDSQDNCEANAGSWFTYCKGAKIYNSTRTTCLGMQGEWQGYGPFNNRVKINNDGLLTQDGSSKLEIDLNGLSSTEQLQLIYRSKFDEADKILTKAGDVYTATAYLRANQALVNPVVFSLAKIGPEELSSRTLNLYDIYSQAVATLVTTSSGRELNLIINLPGGQPDNSKVYLDSVDMYLNSASQVYNSNFVRDTVNYTDNNKVYYKLANASYNCHGYGPGDPPPVLNAYTSDILCREEGGGYWDASGLFTGKTGVCYKYPPDNANCANYAKVCESEEVGCQLYKPRNGDPEVPGVISTTDFCPAECVGYNTYTQQPALYEPKPEPLYNYFIPETAKACSLDQAGCSQFTSLDAATIGGESIQYFTYLRQCIKPNLNLGEKFFYSWPGLNRPLDNTQILKYQFQADATGAPKLFDHLLYVDESQKDCRNTLGSDDLNCVKFYDDNGKIYYRDLRKTISVSENCHPYLRTIASGLTADRIELEQENCLVTNGTWQSVGGQDGCVYSAIPEEGIQCSADNNGCRGYVGNRGNNVYVRLFETFENSGVLSWYTGTEGDVKTGLTISGESVAVGGHSLQVASGISAIHNFVSLEQNGLYTLSFWAKTNNPAGNVISVRFTGASNEQEFATLASQKVKLTTDWKNFTLGPVSVNWEGIEGAGLIFDGLNSQVNFDNILLKQIRDNVFIIKDSWVTPTSCDRNIYGLVEPQNPHPMLGCQAYDDVSGQTYNLKSFTSLCRNSAVGCQLLFDTRNSQNPNSQTYNLETDSTADDNTVPKDKLITIVMDNKYSCSSGLKGCMGLGLPSDNSSEPVFSNIYLLNDPDKYVSVPNSILCNADTFGCSELTNDEGINEYYKIVPNQLCTYSKGESGTGKVEGWYKKGTNIGCGSYDISDNNRLTVAECLAKGGMNSVNFNNQCVPVLVGIKKSEDCARVKGDWVADKKVCLGWPYTIYKNYEANTYQGYIGECAEAFSGCNAFIDINPNFVFNGSFESVGPTNNVVSWQTRNISSGGRKFETGSARGGSQSIRLSKRTDADCPETALYDDCDAPIYSLSQQIARLEKGKTYRISFYYRMPLDSDGRGESCQKPQAAVEFNPQSYCKDNACQTQETCTGTRVGDCASTWVTIPKEISYVFEPEADWKKGEVIYSVPSGLCSNDTINNKADCELRGEDWTEYDPLINYDLSLLAPLNGSCTVNGQKIYQNEDKTYILSQDQCAGLGGIWQGNCPESYVLYDLLQVKEDSEDAYPIVDDDINIDRAACGGTVNWDNGCVQFLNTNTDSLDIIKVQRDRKCEQWAVCDSYCNVPRYKTKESCESSGNIWNTDLCSSTDLCQEAVSDSCTNYAPKKDNVRYNFSQKPMEIKRVADQTMQEGYIYRFGTSALDRLSEWRAGDYSGYTMPYRYPLEAELTIKEALPENTTVAQFNQYDQINDLDTSPTNDQNDQDARYTLPICKVFPAQDSPFPAQMANVPKYKNLLNLYSYSYLPKDLGNLCSYQRVDAQGVSLYLPLLDATNRVTSVCTSPANLKGKICKNETDCGPEKQGVTRCNSIESIKEFYGMENICLEFDQLNPVYGDIYKNTYVADGNYQPYACLTFYPFGVNLCSYYSNQTDCTANSLCVWTTTGSDSSCQLNALNSKPILAQVTPLDTTTMTYKFTSAAKGTLDFQGVCVPQSGFDTVITEDRVGDELSVTFNTLTPGTYNNCRISLLGSISSTTPVLNIPEFIIE